MIDIRVSSRELARSSSEALPAVKCPAAREPSRPQAARCLAQRSAEGLEAARNRRNQATMTASAALRLPGANLGRFGREFARTGAVLRALSD